MTDIEQLRQDVIEAAREQALRCMCDCKPCCRVEAAVRSLDAAETPDPWALLRRAK